MAFEIPPYFQEKLFLKLALEKRRWIGAGAAFIAGVAVLIGYFQMGPGAASYARAGEAFAKWAAAPEDEELYGEMRRALKGVPVLEERFGAPIAQELLNGGRVAEALELAEHSLKRLKEEAPLHGAFGETSLLIEEGAFQKALERAVSLKEQMEQEWDIEGLREGAALRGGVILYAENLLRIAFLQKEVGNRPGERAAWEEFEAFVGKEGLIAELVYGNFRQKGIDLVDYIAERKKVVQP